MLIKQTNGTTVTAHFNRQGICNAVRDNNTGKLLNEVSIYGVIYRRNKVYKTYNSIDVNTLLSKHIL